MGCVRRGEEEDEEEDEDEDRHVIQNWRIIVEVIIS